jgi:hypothetical protein
VQPVATFGGSLFNRREAEYPLLLRERRLECLWRLLRFAVHRALRRARRRFKRAAPWCAFIVLAAGLMFLISNHGG